MREGAPQQRRRTREDQGDGCRGASGGGRQVEHGGAGAPQVALLAVGRVNHGLRGRRREGQLEGQLAAYPGSSWAGAGRVHAHAKLAGETRHQRCHQRSKCWPKEHL